MKFALTDHRTHELLQSSHESPWSLIPFFFHDRGSDVQKTVSGLLQEILYQLLDKYQELVPLIFHIRLNHLVKWISGLRTSKGVEIGRDSFDSQWNQMNATRAQQLMKAVEEEKSRQKEKRQVVSELLWQPSEVDEALDVIMRQSKVPLYCLLFIDALDEHSGDHETLLEALKRFTNRDGTGASHIKLCLASRPEPLFLMTLGDCPGFAIHNHTQADIKTYTFGRLKTVFTGWDRSYDSTMLKQLAGEVTRKANGVFIWVKIVVDNLVEAVIDGSSITQLNSVLSDLPDDLMQLYRRIIQKRKPAYLKEAYVMFQLVIHSVDPLSLEALMAATDVILSGHWDPAPDDVMQRRLVSRCGGLLDLVLKDTDEEVVQLVHQTLKEYLRVSDNATLGLSFPSQNPETDGLKYLLRYGVYIATQMNRGAIKKHFKTLRSTFNIARELGIAGVDVTSKLDGLLKASVAETDGRQVDGLRVWNDFGSPKSLKVHPRAGDTGFDRDYDLMLVAAKYGCISYVRQKVFDGLPVTLPDRCPLMLSIITGTSWLVDHDRVDDTIELLDLLLAKGSDVNCEWENSAPLSDFFRYSEPSTYCKVMIPIVLWLLKHGADPNRKFPYMFGKMMFLKEFAVLLQFQNTPMMKNSQVFSHRANFGLTKLLLRSGLDPMMKDPTGYTNLFHAIDQHNVEIAELLCQHGADPTQLGNGIDALNPETFDDKVLEDSWLREENQDSPSALKMRDVLQHYSDPKNRGLAKRSAV